MSRDPGALWRPLNVNYQPGGNTPRLVILHIVVGSLGAADSWFRNPAAEVSAHFGASKGGELRQWVDTGDTAWHAANANTCSIGVENEGWPGDHLTAGQVSACAQVLAWAHKAHGIPLQASEKLPSGWITDGLAYHGLGGANWGNHPNCPGDPIIAQRDAIVAAARQLDQPAVPWYWHAALGYFTHDGHPASHDSGPVTVGGRGYYWHAEPRSGVPYLSLDGVRVQVASGPATWG